MKRSSKFSAEFYFLTVSRILVNTSVRMIFTFLGPISRGLHINEASLGGSMVVMNLSGLTGPFAGRAGDRIGRHHLMASGILTIGLGSLFAGLANSQWTFAAGMAVIGLGAVFFSTSMTAWVSDSVDYKRRGFAIGITELSWAAALGIGLPLVGAAINLWSWQAPFFAIAGLAVPISAVIWFSHNREVPHEQPPAARFVFTSQAVQLFIAIFVVSFGHQLIIVSHGLWLERTLDLNVSGLGAVAIPLGLGEFIGALGMLAFTDRLGKSRSASYGFLLVIPFAALLGPLGNSRLTAILLLAGILLTFEFGFVSAIPMFTELNSGARATALGIAMMFITGARAAATLVGAKVFESHGMTWLGVSTAIMMLAGALLVWNAGDPGDQALPLEVVSKVSDK